MIYAQINTQNEIIQFPYYIDDRREVPEDAIPVDTETRKPTRTWDKKLFYDSVENVDGIYVLNYRVEERYDTQEEKIHRLEKEIQQAQQNNEKWFNRQTEQLKTTYPQNERDSWATQREEALAYSKDNTVDTPLLTVVADARGVTLDEMVSKVLENVRQYDATYGFILGVYQRNKDLLLSVDVDDESTWVKFDEVSFPAV